MTPIEQLEKALAEVSTLKESVAVLTSRAESAEAFAEDSISAKDALAVLRYEFDASKNELAALNEKFSAVSSERDALAAELKRMKDERAIAPAAYADVSDGTKPVASGNSDDGVTTWAEALKACGNDYVKARSKYPRSHEAFMRDNKIHKP